MPYFFNSSQVPYCEARDVILLRRSVDQLRAALAEPVPIVPDQLPELPPKVIFDLSAVRHQIALLRGKSTTTTMAVETTTIWIQNYMTATIKTTIIQMH